MRFMRVAFLALSLAGCSAFADMGAEKDGQRIYGGTRYNVWLLSKGADQTHAGGFAVLWGFFDFPFSLAFDTVFLPVTLIFAIARSGE